MTKLQKRLEELSREIARYEESVIKDINLPWFKTSCKKLAKLKEEFRLLKSKQK